MAPLSRRHCLYREDGCPWQTPECKQITTMAEAKIYVRAHSTEFIYNPAVVQDTQHKREREAADTARRIAIEVAEVNQRIAVEDR